MGLGFVAPFSQNNALWPQLAVTREELVSLVWKSLKGIPGANITFPSHVSIRPFSDVDISRCAGKLLLARSNKIVSYYQDGTFKPTQPVTRAELMAVLPRAAEFGLSGGRQPNLVVKESSKTLTFSDTQNYWAASIITQMSAYCSVAAAINEIGNRFAFDDSAQRNYAAAATLRMLKCVKTQ